MPTERIEHGKKQSTSIKVPPPKKRRGGRSWPSGTAVMLYLILKVLDTKKPDGLETSPLADLVLVEIKSYGQDFMQWCEKKNLIFEFGAHNKPKWDVCLIELFLALRGGQDHNFIRGVEIQKTRSKKALLYSITRSGYSYLERSKPKFEKFLASIRKN